MNNIEFNFPPKVIKKIKEKYKFATNDDIELTLTGALSYFKLCKENPKKNIPMPSVVVDEVWHEFILHTKNYAEFCEKYIGFFLHHTPNDESNPVDHKKSREQILSLWILACQDEGFDPTNINAMPTLFYADVAFGEKDMSYIKSLASEVKSKVLNKDKKPTLIDNVKKSLGFKEKSSKSSSNSSSDFDLNSLILTIFIIDDVKMVNDHSGSISSKNAGDDNNFSHNVTTKNSCNSCGSNDNSSTNTSSCGSGCGGGD